MLDLLFYLVLIVGFMILRASVSAFSLTDEPHVTRRAQNVRPSWEQQVWENPNGRTKATA